MDRIFSGRLALAAVDHISGVLNNTVSQVAVGCGNNIFIILIQKKKKRKKKKKKKNQVWLNDFSHVFECVSYPPMKSNHL